MEPYIKITKTIIELKYNPEYGDDRICECGHSYDRHFDSYEDMDPVGCKYCDCYEFVEVQEGKDTIEDAKRKGYDAGSNCFTYVNPYSPEHEERLVDAYKEYYNFGKK